MLWQEIKDDISKIYQDLKCGCGTSCCNQFTCFTCSDIVRSVASGYNKLWSQYTQIKQQWSSTVSSTIKALQSEFDDITKIVIEG